MVRMDQLHEGRNEFVLKSKSHMDTGVVSFSVAGLEWSQPREGLAAQMIYLLLHRILYVGVLVIAWHRICARHREFSGLGSALDPEP